MDDDDEGDSWHRNCVAARNNADAQNHWITPPPIPLAMSDEIWCPDLHDRDFTLGAEGGLGPKGKVTLSSRFNRLALGYTNPDRPLGVLAAVLESGRLELWDPAQITDKTDVPSAWLLRNAIHTGPVRAPHLNPSKHPSSRLVASAANSIPGISIARNIRLLTLPVLDHNVWAELVLSGGTPRWHIFSLVQV
ncbi:Protein transport protein SEC31 OS=Ustilago maydis (strain 521 / FGSC 9021) GN=SEC31 PE=3 SV=1 [Rhizoctonia solani AG-1 IB]|uniref:Protein transport protein SEC31 n=1 Tax=Thanatephorus cucumeris (strain AG1-IB / isolate 7/3/14) TaxID=1108050 RepID=A0A0B7FWH9_THACB|nr:Protein transport protein SEC31 OS=Ustilago maydis (strain 521 / FGSC 9021) GN=SEC31 PE=3 SV=1 [Rhizoctonia solani AG-1 IB]